MNKRAEQAAVRRAVARLARVLALSACLAAALSLSVDVSAQESEPQSPGIAAEPDAHEPEAHAEEEHHSVWAGLLWPTANFLVLFGGLYYFLATPIANYLKERHTSIRKELVEAASVNAAAQAQLAELDRKLQALPGEIAALRQRGAEEIAAEEERIAALAAAERDRLVEQTRREIELQLRLAKRELLEHTADLAVQLAGNRIAQQITPADQDRIVDRYLDNVGREGTH